MDKSTAKKEYKENKRAMGVYTIRNSADNIAYVGYGIDVQARINRHRTELRFGSHRNKELQRDWKTFGESSFQFEVLDELKSKDDIQTDEIQELQVLSDMWICKLEQEGRRAVKL